MLKGLGRFLITAVVSFVVIAGALVLNNHSIVSVDYSIADEVSEVISSAVHVRNLDAGCQGSGVLVGADGLVLTAHHVVDGGDRFEVTLNDKRTFKCSRAIISRAHDVAFLKLEVDEQLPFAELRCMDGLRVGDVAFLIGSPYGAENFNSVTMGIISALQREVNDEEVNRFGWTRLVQTDTPSNSGNSGGPLFAMDGKVVGVLVGGVPYSDGVSYCVKVEEFVADLDQIRLLFGLDRYRVGAVESELRPGNLYVGP